MPALTPDPPQPGARPLLLARVLAVIGIVLLLAAAGWYINGKADQGNNLIATALIVDSTPVTVNGRAAFTPVVQFTTSSGQAISVTLDQSSATEYRVGSTVRVIYQPGPPLRAEPETDYRPLRPATLTLAGALLCGIGSWYFGRRYPLTSST